jgi:vacuolar-type H+-ATPase subunit I/STV1
MMCSPYLTGSLALMLLLVTFNYWSVSTNNFDLTKEVTVMQSQLKAGSATIDEQGKDLKDRSSELKKERERVENLQEQIKRLESVKEDLKICETSKETMIKDGVDREEQAGRAGRRERERAEAVRAGLAQDVAALQARLDTQAGLLAAAKAVEPSHVMAPGHLQARGEAAGLGPGQLPDVNPKAVSVVKKETHGEEEPLK